MVLLTDFIEETQKIEPPKEVCVEKKEEKAGVALSESAKANFLRYETWRSEKNLVKCPLMKNCLNNFCEQECALYEGKTKEGVFCTFIEGQKYEIEEAQEPYTAKFEGKTQLFFEGWVKKRGKKAHLHR